MKLEIKLRSTFGSPRAYPDDDAGKLLTELTGTKTLTLEHLRVIHKMGIRVQVIDWDQDCVKWMETIERWEK